MPDIVVMRRRIQLITLDCALVIAEEGSILGASRRIGIHHSALSRRIRDLEHSLATKLFDRHAGGVQPTPAGAGFLRRLRRILGDLDSTLAMVRTGQGAQPDSPGSGNDLLPQASEFLDAIADLIRSRPDIALRLVETKHSASRLP
ncbi:LysR family transcriptional regulator [Mesorhizobium sp. ES1-6]|uniref:LysR family transcriptional regulator n=1 Tax=Mesorhizobium sp. ES1-6 TaxID=2876626 RepID=UPI001CCF6724|nr:LysR family transcriptional regulator [Mesorhizobium sp. ES1-6]MBZ9801161.1 LysR family transcriptional regulator [Mesorhizobium sp. ES1-6]